jgi:hypothetical protein
MVKLPQLEPTENFMREPSTDLLDKLTELF